jgi:hypothetical protein
MPRWSRPWRRQALLAAALAAVTITGAGAATYHRLAVTQSAGGGSEGATEFLQTSNTGGAVQGEVNGSAYTGLPYPFGLFGFYHASTSTFGIGTLGISTTGNGVYGAASGSNAAILAYGEGTGPALQAVTTQAGNTSPLIYAVPAPSANADGIAAAIDGNSENGNVAVSGGDNAEQAIGNAGVYGFSRGDSFGVAGIAYVGSGVYQLDGVYGSTQNNASGTSVEGYSDGGTGVLGTSTSGSSINAFSDGASAGVFTQTGLASPAPNINLEDGMYASAQNGAGLFAISMQDPAIAAEMGCNEYINPATDVGQNCSGLFVTEDGTNGYPLEVYQPSSTISKQSCPSPLYPFYVDSGGNIFQCGVTISSNVYQRSSNPGSDAVTYAPKQTESTVEDFGTAQLVNGSASVALAPDFKKTIDARSPYMVFTMPHGDSRRLYLASQSQTGFVIRESRGGRSTVTFDYRIVARPFGNRLARLPHESQIIAHRPIGRPSQITSYAQIAAASQAHDRALFAASERLAMAQRLAVRRRLYGPPQLPANFARALKQ